MKAKLVVFLSALTCLLGFLPATGRAQVQLTGLRIFGLDANDNRMGSYYNTVGGDVGYNIYLFTGSVDRPHFLNSGNTDESLNPHFNLPPGTYRFGFAGDVRPCKALNLELCFNGESSSRISVVVHDGDLDNFTGQNTFSEGGLTVTLSSIRTFDKPVDLVSPYEHTPDGNSDIGGFFTLVVTRKTQIPATPVTLNDFKLTGKLTGDIAAFTLTGTAKVDDSHGGQLVLLAGPVALTSLAQRQSWDLSVNQNQFIANFNHRGNYSIELHFNAQVRHSNDWNTVNFQVSPSALQPIILQGLAPDTEFQFANAARPDRQGTNFISYLPVDGTVNFAWRQSVPESEGKLFYAAEMTSQVSVSPGLMRQTALFTGKIMQGEMNRMAIRLHGPGEVTRVQGDAVLAWNVEPATNSDDQMLLVQFNQPQKDSFSLTLQMQTPLGAFPQSADVVQVHPVGATRFVGSYRIVNDGAVRLEVTQANGLSQISPEQFPESDGLRATGTQQFAYRFSSEDYAVQVHAEQIFPEVAVSQVLAYSLGENELAVDAQIELDIREAPLRELLLNIPKGYAVANISASGLSDYFTSDTADHTATELRLVYGQPVSDRQLVNLRLERNQSLGETNWVLPRVEVEKAKSVRGFVGVSADGGYRLTAERTQSLTEIATAFFPLQLAGIQSAFRLSDPNWEATMRVERLPQTLLVDAFHLFSIGEGIAYGSSVMNYSISGAPVSTFHVDLSDEYYNVEFTGKDIRNWEKTTNGYIVQLHTPVSGPYTLLATYERPFKSQGDTLAFTGARPLDAQSESGHTIVVSANQFDVKPVDISPNLLALEPNEVPAEYRLFFDKPILKAYRYVSRPFNLKLSLSPLAQGDSLAQVVDRAALETHISKEGQVLTDIHYLVKSRGNPNFRLTLPAGVALWSATINGTAVVPVVDGQADLIPLPQHADPDAVLALDLKLASRSDDPKYLNLALPIVNAPVMLAQWKLKPDDGQRLMFHSGSLSPVNGSGDISGFSQLVKLLQGNLATPLLTSFATIVLFVLLTLAAWRWSSSPGVPALSLRHVAGVILGLITLFIASMSMLAVIAIFQSNRLFAPGDELVFLAPVQQAGSALTAQVSNLPVAEAHPSYVFPFVLAALAVFAWINSWLRDDKFVAATSRVLGWVLLAWAALRLPNGGAAFVGVVTLFIVIHVIFPGLKAIWRLPARTAHTPNLPPPEPGVNPIPTALIIAACLLAGSLSSHAAVDSTDLPNSVTQQIQIQEKFAIGTAKIHWHAEKGDALPLLFQPAVMTHLDYSKNLKLVAAPENCRSTQELVAQSRGTYDVSIQYQMQVTRSDAESGFELPLISGLVNNITVSVSNLDVDVFSPQAISVQRTTSGSNTVASLVLTPGNAWLGWKPRSRDVKHEKSVFYADISQLYVPSAGVIEGIHQVSIRPAQGELSELTFDVPVGATIIDVTDGSGLIAQNGWSNRAGSANSVSLWRFDPDQHRLRVTLNPAQSHPFVLTVRSQVSTGPLPFERQVGLLSVEGAAGQIGSLGVATGNEVQLDSVNSKNVSAINLEDFPSVIMQPIANQFPGLTVRQAFRYSSTDTLVAIKASPVEPDVRVETQNTLSLGEDRTVLAATANVAITRAGIFKLSFVLPGGFDVESISGAALSHWTELKTDAGRVITLNLTGKTEGQQQFVISLAGPGIKTGHDWTVPQVILREAEKQHGTLLVVPEQGMRLEVVTDEGVSQLDPQKSGINQKGVLAFRLLETSWHLALNIEQVDPWIQVTSLEHAMVNDAQVKVFANLQYQIENTGLKTFRVFVPADAEGVNFHGDQVVDFAAVNGVTTNGLQAWDIKLHRRIIGPYLLQLNYSVPVAAHATGTTLRGVVAADVNLQRGYTTIESAGRLQLGVDNLPDALQPTEWQGIPRALQKDLSASAANFAYRLVEPDFTLPLKLERHEAAQLLPAHVNNITLTSVISDTGTMLTQAHLEILPGDKPFLKLMLPKDAQFWFAFVNQNGVWPWRTGDEILIPLEQQSRGDQVIPVEIYFTSNAGQPGATSAQNLSLIAPKFDLPLENLTWRVFLNNKWQVKKWQGDLQLQEEKVVTDSAPMDLNRYLASESSWQNEKTRQAQQMLDLGNTALQNGDPQKARKAFESAYGLSTHDEAFNEDARVQLNNLKLQQALIGLNVRQATVAGAGGGAGANPAANSSVGNKLLDLHNNGDANYTQQDAKDIIGNNSADDNAAMMKLAQRLIQQEDAAVTSQAVIRANVPEQGRLLTFKRAVVVQAPADLSIHLHTASTETTHWGLRGLILLGTTAVVALLLGLASRLVKPATPQAT